jgi:hypothetical protein
MISQPISRSVLGERKCALDNSFRLNCRKRFSNRADFSNVQESGFSWKSLTLFVIVTIFPCRDRRGYADLFTFWPLLPRLTARFGSSNHSGIL